MKKNFKFNIIDLLIVLIAAVALISIFFKVEINDMLYDTEKAEFELTLSCTAARDVAALVEADDVLTEDATALTFGSVRSLKRTSAAGDGALYDMTLTVRATGYIKDELCYIDGGILIVEGKTFELKTKLVSLSGVTIVAINVISGGGETSEISGK